MNKVPDIHKPDPPGTPKVMAVASAGGHWVQLQRMRAAWSGCNVVYVTTTPDYRDDVLADAKERNEPQPEFVVVPDANRWNKLKLVQSLFAIAATVLRHRPDVVVSTGAAPGYFALRLARLFGARTIWIDSIANAEELSLSGQKARHCADVWLTQWEELATADGPRFWGAVI